MSCDSLTIGGSAALEAPHAPGFRALIPDFLDYDFAGHGFCCKFVLLFPLLLLVQVNSVMQAETCFRKLHS